MGDIHTRMYRDGTLADEGFALGDVSEHLAAPPTIVWIDLYGPSRQQLHNLGHRVRAARTCGGECPPAAATKAGPLRKRTSFRPVTRLI